MRQVTRILISDAPCDFLPRRTNPECDHKFRGIFYLGGKLAHATDEFGVMFEQVGVLFHGGAAAGGVGDDGIAIQCEHSANVLPGKLARLLAESGVGMQCAAAVLVFGNENFHSILVLLADGGSSMLRK